MSEKIMSNDEIKLFTGLTAADAKIEVFNRSMTAVLADMLNIKQFSRRTIQNEEIEVYDQEYFRLQSFPVVADSIVLYLYNYQQTLIQNYTYHTDDYDFKRWNIQNSEGRRDFFPYECVYATYTAGFLLQGTVEINDNDLEGITLTVTSLGVDTVYSFIASGVPEATEILIGADVDATMTAIATKIGGTGGDGFVTMPLGMTAATSEVSATPKIVIENPDEMLDELKLALAYLVAGAIGDKTQVEGIQSYRLGNKSVNYRDTSEKDFIENVIKKYLSKYNTASIIG